MIKTIVTGAKGRMGSFIVSLIGNDPSFELTAGIDIEDNLADFIENCDVVIDFSAPSSSAENAILCARNKKPIIIGTTGLSNAEEGAIKGASKDVAIVYSPNMSIGVNVMLRLIRIATQTLGENYDINIVESHHLMKKDRPSGTANKMAQVILEGLGGNKEVSHYEEAMAKRKVDDHSIRICSIREDEVVGDHEIEYRGTGESIKISHHASTRKIFAEGAVRAASWIIDRPAGLYTMEDVLFLKTCA